MCSKYFTVILLLFANCLMTVIDSYKILGLFPHPAISHTNVFYPVMKGLAEKGHEVTMISHYNFSDAPPNMKLSILHDSEDDLVGAIDLSYVNGYRIEKYLNPVLLAYFGTNTCHRGLTAPIIQDLINDKDQTFDVVMMEFFNSDCFAPIAYKFNAPLIGLSSCTMLPWTHERFANTDNPSYIQNTNMDYPRHLNFLQRVENTVNYIAQNFLFNYIMRMYDNYVIRKYYKNNDIPDISDIIHNASALLVNTHYSLNLPKPLVPSIIEIGGVHVGKTKQLPKNIEKWINESEHGVIYFSFGSIIKGHTFPEDKKLAFLRAFGRLPQRVLWKWENETMAEKPDNVMIQKWMPQADILSHPNVRAYIAHGGLLGTIEAVHNGVPMIVMPQFGDQHTNAKAVEASGGGVVLQLYEADEEKIYNALKTILDPNFRKGAQELSARFRDRPLPPLETAIYWVEYVARHRGARHMRTAAVDMPLYKYLLLDVIAFLTAISIGVLLIAWFITKAIFRRMFKKKTPKRKTN